MKYLLFICACMLAFCSCSRDEQQIKVSFRVHGRAASDDSHIYIAGNQDALGRWDPGSVKLNKINDSLWTGTFSFPRKARLLYKITCGSWLTEALDKKGQIPENLEHTAEKDTTIDIAISGWRTRTGGGGILLSRSTFQGVNASFELGDQWRFHNGDNPLWARTDFNDSSWEVVDVRMPPYRPFKQPFTGLGWFRFSFTVDSSMFNQPIAMFIGHLGASEVYLNGRLVKTFGHTGPPIEDYKPLQNRDYFQVTLADYTHQVLAVRYANYDYRSFLKMRFGPGFSFFVTTPDYALSQDKYLLRYVTIFQCIFAGIPLVLMVVHFLLFAFYPKLKENLYYAICLFGFVLVAFTNVQRYIITDVDNILLLYLIAPVGTTISIIFGLFTSYSTSLERLPRQAWYLALLCIVSLAVEIFVPAPGANAVIFLPMLAVFIEVIRFGLTCKSPSKKGSWLVALGFFILAVFVVIQLLADYEIIDISNYNFMIYGYGVIGLVISMSIYLSYNFATINRELEEQLRNVEYQSNLVREQEISRRLLEADNNRKTRELEDARRLQLSLLPQQIPSSDQFDIAVYLKTATEVGGDYYDFHVRQGNGIMAAIGDATDHGAKAGTMVAATKSVFNSLSDVGRPLEFICRANAALKGMNLHGMYMCLSIVDITDHSVTYSNAGMPPAFLYRAKDGCTETIVQKSMPLGSFLSFPYCEESFTLDEGDVLLLMSDGADEMFNPEKEMIGSDRLKDIFEASAGLSAQQIVDRLKCSLEEWAQGYPQQDDVTIMVFKSK